MFKSLDSVASVVGIFMYLTISKFKQVLRSRKGLDYNTGNTCRLPIQSIQNLKSIKGKYGFPLVNRHCHVALSLNNT